jgi:hypothetical protein
MYPNKVIEINSLFQFFPLKPSFKNWTGLVFEVILSTKVTGKLQTRKEYVQSHKYLPEILPNKHAVL